MADKLPPRLDDRSAVEARSRHRPAGVAATLAPLARRLEQRLGAPLPVGVRLWDGSELPAPPDSPATVVLRSPRALSYLLHEPGELGLGRAFVSSELEVDGDLEAGLALRDRFAGVRIGALDKLAALRALRDVGALTLRSPRPPAAEAALAGALHTLRRDRAAISHHYDVSNDFYRIVLGETMVYSCAYFGDPDDDLDSAQRRKLDLICRKLQLREGERLLDIGCGWGALVVHAAKRYGVRAVGVTLSEEQAREARQRIRDAGVADHCEIRVADYREVADGPYDKIASVGMYEHVGRALIATYVDRVRALLRPGGLFLNHGITRLVPRPWSSKSFIARYVFPDGELHPLATIVDALQDAGLELRDVESLREHYPRTLRAWVANLAAGRERAIADAGEQRERVWRLYMTGSALAFERGEISLHQTLAAKPGAPHGLPPTRAQLLDAAP